MRQAWTAMVRAGAKIWRNNVGMGVTGRIARKGSMAVVYGASPIRFGLCPGSPDLIGYLPMTITSDMVGRKVAVFVGAESKDQNGRLSEEQKKFIAVASEDGAICFEFRSVGEALDKLRV